MEEKDRLEALGTLSTRTLGIVALLLAELVEAKAIDRERFESDLADFDRDQAGQELTSAEQNMARSIMQIVTKALEAKNG
jgi:hypothetical protein